MAPTTLHITKYMRMHPASVDLKAKISGYYANGLLGFLDAKKKGYEQPLFLDQKGFLAEGAVNNIFVVKNNVIYTPKSRNILKGITRESVIAVARSIKIKVVESDIKPSFLKSADEIFLTGTGIQLQKVVKVDKLFKQKPSHTPITDLVLSKYKEASLGQIPAFRNWLRYIK